MENVLIDEVKVHMIYDTWNGIKRYMWNFSTLFLCKFVYSTYNSTIIHAEKLNKKTIQVLLNEILTTNKEENENRMEAFAHENNIMRK